MTTNPTSTQTSRPSWLPVAEYPFQLRAIELGDHAVTYVDEGEGATLLFVHTGMWSFVFRDVIVWLRHHYRCVALDFPGFGLSSEPPGRDLDLAEQSELLGRFVAALDLRDITLVLHDLGGLVGMGFAAAHPDRVVALVMANTFAWEPDRTGLIRMLRLASSRPVTAADVATRLIPRLSTTRFGVGRHLSRAGKRAFLGPVTRRRVRRFHDLIGNALDSQELSDRIAAGIADGLGDLPILTIFGERNDPFGFQERHHAIFPNHHGIVVAKGNHFPMMDDPDLFATTLHRWRSHLG